jgi:hypothetical protein
VVQITRLQAGHILQELRPARDFSCTLADVDHVHAFCQMRVHYHLPLTARLVRQLRLARLM